MKASNLRRYDIRNRWKDNEDRQLLLVVGLFSVYSLLSADYTNIVNVFVLVGLVYGIEFIYEQIKNDSFGGRIEHSSRRQRSRL